MALTWLMAGAARSRHGGAGRPLPLLAATAWRASTLGQSGLFLVHLQDCFDLEDARRSYFQQLFPLNPGGITPSGPTAADLGFDEPAGRGSAAYEDVFHLC